ncbi:MAG: helix-turn-helix domain-containing protein [Candidatus Bathyarchaeia archaeon]|jgi:DNA-binding HxlR family transcriptional regulator
MLGSRGTLDILCVFSCGTKTVRFNQLNSLLGHISTKTLASRLKELEKNGILRRTAYNEIPPRGEYSITEKGQNLTEVLVPLVLWVEKWAEKE